MKMIFKPSISLKLKAIIVLVTFFALSAAIGFIIFNEYRTLRNDLIDNTVLNAKLVGEYCVTPILFDDEKGCLGILEKTEAIPYITDVTIYDTNYKQYVQFIKKSSTLKTEAYSKPQIKDGILSEGDILHVIKPIIYNNINYGTIHIRSSYQLVKSKTNNYILLMLLLLVIAIIITYILASNLQKIISKPILKLARLTKEISDTGNFNISLVAKSNDEIGTLYLEFNNMLKEIILRNKEREDHALEIYKLNEGLEAKVIERTSQLSVALEKLDEENQQRKINEELLKKINIELEESRKSILADSRKLIDLNTKLLTSEKELKELNSTKDRFFSIIAHDLKNPIGAVTLISSLLVDYYTKLDDKSRLDHLNQILSASKVVKDLLENLLSWGQLMSGKTIFSPENCHLKTLVEKTFETYSLTASNKGVNLTYSIKGDDKAFADSNMIYTVMRNLVSNAVKFTMANGNISVEIEENENCLMVKVVDSGVGISSDDLKKLFRIDIVHSSKGTANERGTGLGLIVCKEFIEKHESKLTVISELAKGTSFSFCLPKGK
ncbi:MAG: ATP-binding protein [Candidatus Kapabacteria bacterium]|nr:ATP-binding protein [Candidatus Kapabacteria bacterium]